MRPRSALSEEERRERLQRRAELATLAKHPGFGVLVAAIEERAADQERQAIAHTLRGEQPIDVQRLLYLRGYLAAMRWVVGLPEMTEEQLERELRQGVEAA